MTSVLLHLLKFVLWTEMWSTLVNVLCALKKNVYSALVDGVFYMFQIGHSVFQVFSDLTDYLSTLLIL